MIDILDQCDRPTIPLKEASNAPGITRWEEYVRPRKEQPVFGTACGRTHSQGQPADLRRHTRPKYHRAIN